MTMRLQARRQLQLLQQLELKMERYHTCFQ